jgi:uncharacterized protein
MVQPKITEVELEQLLQACELSPAIIKIFIQDYYQGMQGDNEKLVSIASFFHEAMMYEEAYYFYHQAAKSQHPAAIYMLGNYAYEGLVDEEDEAQAFQHYERAANLGHADAMNNLADMYLNGESTEQDEQLALKWFEKAAELGVLEAMFTLGIMYEQGLGVEEDEQIAFNYYESAALGGDREALFRLGTIYFTPLLNVPQNMEKAIYYFELAAEQEQIDSIYNLAYIYEQGMFSEVNGEKAVYYYQLAAELDDVTAIHALIRLYSEGSIIPKNEVMAKKWSNYLKDLLRYDSSTFGY